MKFLKGLGKVLFYFLLVLLVLFAMGLVILSAFGGNSDQLKKNVEEIAGGVSGTHVKIGVMQAALFFPDLMFDGEDVTFTQRVDEDIFGETFFVKKLQFSLPFWSVFWGKPAFEHFYVSGGRFLGDDSFRLEEGKIELVPHDQAYLNLNGALRNMPFSLSYPLTKSWGGYVLGQGVIVTGLIGEIRFEAYMNERALSDRPFQKVVFHSDGPDIIWTVEDEGKTNRFEASDRVFMQIPVHAPVSEGSEKIYLDDIKESDAFDTLVMACSLGMINVTPIYVLPDLTQEQIFSCAPPEEGGGQ